MLRDNEKEEEAFKEEFEGIIKEANAQSPDVKEDDIDEEVSTIKNVIVPSIGVDGQIVQGDSVELLKEGFWHRPDSSTPDKGGNTVITGHRFLYTSGPKTFYHLDKVEVGDQVKVEWEGRDYYYEVFDTLEVTPDTIQIEDNTEESILTMYTCAPLWSSTRRLVVRAKLVSTA